MDDKTQKGLIQFKEHSSIISSPTNNSTAKSSFSIPKQARFKWQVNPMHKRISYTDQYTLSSFIKQKPPSCTTFGSTARVVFKPRSTPSPAEYDIGTTFKRSNSSVVISKIEPTRSLSHH